MYPIPQPPTTPAPTPTVAVEPEVSGPNPLLMLAGLAGVGALIYFGTDLLR